MNFRCIFALFTLALLGGCAAAPSDMGPSAGKKVEGSSHPDDEHDVFESAYEGSVTESGDANTNLELLEVGDCLAGGAQSAAILSFDTSSIPDDAEVQFLHLRLRLAVDGRDMVDVDAPELDYFVHNVVIDIADEHGFGGTPSVPHHLITGSDFDAPAASTIAWNGDDLIGMPILFPTDNLSGDFREYVNRRGLTQVRLRFEHNPMHECLMLRETDYGGGGVAQLAVVWR